ncbi:MAG TPA: carboxylesterase family protein [Sphingomicrobium sp.]|nr:carboxylesterase family protein [Sphingomicrobium sp.]
MSKAFVLLSWLALSFLCFPAEAQVVPVDGGLINGSRSDGGYLFRGIPFAAPPVGALRWKPPQPVVAWKGVRDGTSQPASCVQNDQGWNYSDFLIGKEDCLTLDVRTPSMNGRLPVLVWIHGGSNRAGGPNDIVLSDIGKQVLIVGVRYRLGIFGFLSHPALTAEQGASGNYGIMDQIAALRWVHDNIAKFGGDPDNVTIAGESAGSEDVSLLLAAPGARGLFEKAIMESGTPGFGMPFRSLRDAERLGMQADDLLKAGGSIEKMRGVSVPALLAVDLKLHDDGLQSDDMTWLRTTIDGKVLRADPRNLLEEAPPRRVIVGTNKVEFGSDREHRDSIIAKAFGSKEASARAYYRADEPQPPDDLRLGSLDEQIGTDVVFRCPAEHLAQLLSARGTKVWRYEFDSAPGGARTSHAAEIPYAFWNSTFAPGLSLKPYWIDFVRTGDPNGPNLPNWPRFSPEAQLHVLFDAKGVTVEGPLRPQLCQLEDRL